MSSATNVPLPAVAVEAVSVENSVREPEVRAHWSVDGLYSEVSFSE